ncbi:unnamed protein product [Cuscuta europaea]|uniref:GAG-pre-integrase domain-containing protein n=1 Tax=Cuscuta europaea TaxID=41803 RepID=A0A9P0ZB27_CUSEU|nr:unnamed protein product [Cuscuta europaea]
MASSVPRWYREAPAITLAASNRFRWTMATPLPQECPQASCGATVIGIQKIHPSLDELSNLQFGRHKDQRSRRLIGTGERRNGLYYFKEVPKQCVVNGIEVSADLWHKRMGHPSEHAAMEIWSTSRSTTLWEHQPNTKIDRPCCMFKQSKSHNPRYFGNKGRELMNCYVQMCVKSVQILYTQKIVVYMLLTDNISNMHYTPLTCFA